jgi:hypothetical protein
VIAARLGDLADDVVASKKKPPKPAPSALRRALPTIIKTAGVVLAAIATGAFTYLASK